MLVNQKCKNLFLAILINIVNGFKVGQIESIKQNRQMNLHLLQTNLAKAVVRSARTELNPAKTKLSLTEHKSKLPNPPCILPDSAPPPPPEIKPHQLAIHLCQTDLEKL